LSKKLPEETALFHGLFCVEAEEMQVVLRSIVDAMVDLTDTPEGGHRWNELKDRLALYKKEFHAAYVSLERDPTQEWPAQS